MQARENRRVYDLPTADATPAPTPAALARRLAASLGPRVFDATAWNERELLARVSPRPVGGVEVWRLPVAGAIAAAAGEPAPYWAEAVRSCLAGMPGVRETSVRDGAVLVRRAVDDPTEVLPRSLEDCRLWWGAPEHRTITPTRYRRAGDRAAGGGETDGGEAGGNGSASGIDRVGLLAEALAAVAEAAGDHAVVESAPAGDLHGAATDLAGRVQVNNGTEIADIAVARVRVTPLESVSSTERGLGASPVRVSLLAAPPATEVVLHPRDLLARTPSNPAFLLAHTAHTAHTMGAVCDAAPAPGAHRPDSPHPVTVRDDGTRSLFVALAAYPFVVEKAARTADPGVLLRHLLTIARAAARLRLGGAVRHRDEAGVADAATARSTALVLRHGMEALALPRITRI